MADIWLLVEKLERRVQELEERVDCIEGIDKKERFYFTDNDTVDYEDALDNLYPLDK
jgi:hypothetical protein